MAILATSSNFACGFPTVRDLGTQLNLLANSTLCPPKKHPPFYFSNNSVKH